jgi:hypothetical protein
MFGFFTDKKNSYIVLERAFYGTAYDYLRRNRGKTGKKTKLKWALQVS